jgi:L-cysteine/cystine lyase
MNPQPPLRALMPALAGKTYFNYGGQGPLPSPSLEAMVSTWQSLQELGPFSGAVAPFLASTVEGLRQRLARWLGVTPQRLSFTENVTSGCLLPLWGLPWQPGDSLLIGDGEHPGVVAGLQELARRHDLRLTSLPVQALRGDEAATTTAVLAALEQALTPQTRLVVLSHLLWNSGQLMPIAAVAERLGAHPRHPWLLVDAAQSFGSVPLGAAAAVADLYACTGHKWCCGPEGLGVVALSERVLAEARPTLVGWRSLADENSGQASFHRDGRRFEVATSCTPLFAGLDRSLALLEAEGSAEQRLERLRSCSGALWEGLGRIPGVRPLLEVPPPAGLVSFTVAGQAPEALVRRLGERAIWLRSLPEPSCLRACTHITTTAEEVERLLSELQQA